MSAAGWIYPDGTRCQTGSSQYGRNTSGVKMATLCLSGRCEVNIIRIQKVVTSVKFDTFSMIRNFRVIVIR
jgi:hypothetical protein